MSVAALALPRLVAALRAVRGGRERSIAQLRRDAEAFARLAPEAPDLCRRELRLGGVPAERISAGVDPARGWVLHFHGGGYVAGSPATHRDFTYRLAAAANLPVISVDYRLAPEHPFPAAVDDAVAAYRGLLAEGAAAERIAVVGDSAGGGLALALLLSLRAAGVPLPSAAVLLSPWTDLAVTGVSIVDRAPLDPVLSPAAIRRMAGVYLAGADPRTPLASPLYGDLAGLPPLLVQVGTAEILYDDAERIARRAREAGVDTVFEAWPRMIHAWHLFAHLLPEGGRAIRRVADFVAARLAGAQDAARSPSSGSLAPR